ncbi:hypothetical protein F3246_15280 [Listeria monocytogenes]|nr:hypothetical protein [Listeria monocytogenes]
MDLLFQCLFRKIERANEKMMGSLRKERYSAKNALEIHDLYSLIMDVRNDVKDTFYYEISLEDVDKVKLNEEMKKVQLLLYAAQMTKWNLESYIKYFETKDESLLIWKNIMFIDELDAPGGVKTTTIKEILSDEIKAKQFYKPLGYCDTKVSRDDEIWASRATRVHELMNALGVVDIDAKGYLKKWNKIYY